MSLKVYSNDLRADGQSLYKTNTTMRDIATVMEHPEFNAFFRKYFNDSTDVQAMLMLMKIYQSIPSNDPYEKIAILYQVMNKSDVRAMIMDSFNNWFNGNSNKIEDKSGSKSESLPETRPETRSDVSTISHFIGRTQPKSYIYSINRIPNP